MFVCSRTKLGVRHHPGEGLFVALHSRDEQLVQHTIQISGEVFEIIDASRLGDILVILRRSPYLVEEQLIRLNEVGAEALVEAVDQARKRHLLVLGPGCADIGRPLQRIGLALREVDRVLCYLLKLEELQRHLVVQNEGLASTAATSLREFSRSRACR